MLKLYVSVRPFVVGKNAVFPDGQLEMGFRGLDIGHNMLAGDRNIDGRFLYEITVGGTSDYSDQELADYKAVILEGLQLWSAHEKSLESAKELAQQLSGNSWVIDGSSIKPEAVFALPRSRT